MPLTDTEIDSACEQLETDLRAIGTRIADLCARNRGHDLGPCQTCQTMALCVDLFASCLLRGDRSSSRVLYGHLVTAAAVVGELDNLRGAIAAGADDDEADDDAKDAAKDGDDSPGIVVGVIPLTESDLRAALTRAGIDAPPSPLCSSKLDKEH